MATPHVNYVELRLKTPTTFPFPVMHDNKDIHLTCNCQTHELHIERDPEFDNIGKLWYASFWLRGTSSEKSFKQTLRLIWQVIRHGSPYGDEVILDRAGLEELSAYIQEQLKSFELPKPPKGGTGSSALPKMELPGASTISESFGPKKMEEATNPPNAKLPPLATLNESFGAKKKKKKTTNHVEPIRPWRRS
jgi:hypothetical protein